MRVLPSTRSPASRHWSPKPICSSPATRTPRHSEDALSLVFFDTQLEPLLDDLDDRQLRRALGRTWRKMSPSGQAAARRLALSDRAVETLNRLVDGFADD